MSNEGYEAVPSSEVSSSSTESDLSASQISYESQTAKAVFQGNLKFILNNHSDHSDINSVVLNCEYTEDDEESGLEISTSETVTRDQSCLVMENPSYAEAALDVNDAHTTSMNNEITAGVPGCVVVDNPHASLEGMDPTRHSLQQNLPV